MLGLIRKTGNAVKEGLSKREIKGSITIPWNSGLFFQVGIILALMLVFWVVESDWELENKGIAQNERRTVIEKTENIQYQLEQKIMTASPVQQNVPIRKAQKISPLTTITPIDHSLPMVETTVLGTGVDQNPSIDTPMILPGPKSGGGQESLFAVQEVPVFPGCESLSTNEERKECFQSKIQQFIARKFNVDKFSEKYSGQHKRISVQFTINKQGQIAELKALSPDKDLSEEAVQVISKLPQMTPGKNNNVPVEVVYTVPISLNITY